MGKELFRESDKSTALSAVQFTAAGANDVRQAGHIQVFNNRMYDPTAGRYAPALFGPLDTRLGTCQKQLQCETCHQKSEDCVGHFGYLNLEYPVFHVGFFRLTIQLLQCICKRCSHTLVTGPAKQKLIRQISTLTMEYLRRKAIHKKIVTMSKKISMCPNCAFTNSVVKKAVGAVLKIVHAEPISEDATYVTAAKEEKEIKSLTGSAKFTLLDPLRVYNLFKRIDQEDIPFLMVQNNNVKHPLNLLWTRMPVPPVNIRPSVISDTRSGTNEDDITVKLTEIMLINDVLKKHKQEGAPMKTVAETWDQLQIQCALYINSEINGLPPDLQPKKFVRSFAQRLKGKQGRFRGNLSGKRVDFSGRTVISPDPNLKVDQVGIPLLMAKTLTFPEYVNSINIEKMRELVRNGESVHPGANHIIDRKTGMKKFLKYTNLEQAAKHLKFGDIVERHLRDNDIVLFNRQPSLHRVSIMSHRAKVMPYKTLRFNECACTPYNADFDGDEMNIHFTENFSYKNLINPSCLRNINEDLSVLVPQTYEARAEASLLMSIKTNLITPRSGEPLVAAIQDFITAAYLLTHRDTFLTRDEVYRIAAAIIDVNAKVQQRIRVPPPAIIAPVRMWTGKQLVELIIAPESDTKVRVNLNTPNKSHPKELDEFMRCADTYVIIRNNQLLTGMLDKALLGSSSKTNIFYILLRDFGEDYALEAMWRLARISPVYLSNRGFSIGIGDVTPSEGLIYDKRQLLSAGYGKCEEFIEELRIGKLKARPGQTEAGTLESLILRELSQIRDHAGRACVHNLSRNNTPLTMAICGSKGSYINISQMIACVGQQSISGHRPSEGFEFRCLPMFERHDKTPVARGFVENSFYSGLTPTEFFYHTMAGREGLVDTAVKTAETGYMQRRLVKCLEDLTVSYDSTVRTSMGEIVQFRFGEDGLDPCVMEAKDGNVVDFAHILCHVRNTTPFDGGVSTVEERRAGGGGVKTKAAAAAAQRVAAFPDVTKMDKAEMAAYIDAAIEKTRMREMHSQFTDELIAYLHEQQAKNRRYAERCCGEHQKVAAAVRKKCGACQQREATWPTLMKAHYLSCAQVSAFINVCADKLRKAIVEPGTAVGAISATSIGEPSTQMTLKTFHFAGVASMNITEGVPRIKEIINAVRHISTPVITVELVNNRDEKLARRVKSRIEKTTLGEVAEYIEQVFLPDDTFVLVKVSAKRIRLLQLEVTMESICRAIQLHKFPIPMKERIVRPVGKTMILIRASDDENTPVSLALHYLKYNLASVVIKGLQHISRCVIHADEKKGATFQLLVEGTDFREVLAVYEVEPTKTTFNNANSTAEILGIEAARSSIVAEIIATMRSHGIDLDRRHVMLLADLMTYKGEVLGITRNGLAKMKESVLLLASFERTTDHLYEAAFFGQRDDIAGVSESIIMGTHARIGTGMMKLLQQRGPVPPLASLKRVPIFDTPDLKLQM